MFEVGCKICRTRIKVQNADGVYKCSCKEVSVRVSGPVSLVREYTRNASVILK